MALHRCVAPVASHVSYLKLAANSLPRTYPRTYTSSLSLSLSSTKRLASSTAYQPHTLETTPPPPRNADVSETSKASNVPQVNETRPPGAGQAAGTKEPAHQSKLAGAQASTEASSPPSTETAKPKRPKLRPRKAAMNLTPSAITHLKSLLSQPDPKLIRVGVKNRGCSGLAYHLEYVDKPGKFDETVEQDGVKVLIDSKALFSIIGSEMDWVEDKLNQRFVFRNPNIKEQCGCGESFMV